MPGPTTFNAPRLGRPPTVLLADDEPTVRAEAARLLRGDVGCHVCEARDGRHALWYSGSRNSTTSERWAHGLEVGIHGWTVTAIVTGRICRLANNQLSRHLLAGLIARSWCACR